MKIRVAFTLGVKVEGDQPTRDDLITAITDWLESEGPEFGDRVIDYVSEDYDIDFLGTDIDMVKVH